jgi:superfamily II DNA/RNA helicase
MRSENSASLPRVLVATEAAGEGINLQFCSQMINYDIPWNPVRLEQRVGRIHRYGQRNDSKPEPRLSFRIGRCLPRSLSLGELA